MFNKYIINKDTLIKNIKQAKNKNSKICVMAKADCYGLGMKQVSKIIDNYVDFYGVACFFEAVKLKRLTQKPILIVGAFEGKVDLRFSYACHSLNDVLKLKKKNLPIKIHLKVNSGMNRFGFKDEDEFKRALEEIKTSCLIFEGLFTHFATDDTYVKIQKVFFDEYVNMANSEGFYPILHADNSIVYQKFQHDYHMNRLGFCLFAQTSNGFQCPVKIKSKLVQINKVSKGELVGYGGIFIAKENAKVGIIPIGYADGFSREYIGFKLNVRGVECEVLNVCMDCFMLDLTNVNVKKGDDIEILNNVNSLEKFAKYCQQSEYEILTRFSSLRGSKIIKN